jgi:hypothetical protein
MQRTCHKQVHAFIVLNFVSFRNMGCSKINILYELGTNKINILFELGTQTFRIYDGFLEQKFCQMPISESTRILIFQTH